MQGLYSLMDLRLLYENVKGARSAVIVGGGLIGIELAEMLHSREISTSHSWWREESYWTNVLPIEESRMINRVITGAGDRSQALTTELKEIVGNDSGRVRGVITNKEEFIEAQIVGLTAGVSPNIALAKASGIKTGQGDSG